MSSSKIPSDRLRGWLREKGYSALSETPEFTFDDSVLEKLLDGVRESYPQMDDLEAQDRAQYRYLTHTHPEITGQPIEADGKSPLIRSVEDATKSFRQSIANLGGKIEVIEKTAINVIEENQKATTQVITENRKDLVELDERIHELLDSQAKAAKLREDKLDIATHAIRQLSVDLATRDALSARRFTLFRRVIITIGIIVLVLAGLAVARAAPDPVTVPSIFAVPQGAGGTPSGGSILANMRFVSGSAWVNVSSSNRLPVTCDNCSGGGGGSGGTSATDTSTFTEATTAFTPIGGYYQTSPTALTSGKAGTALLTANRALRVALYNSSGVELSPLTDTQLRATPVPISGTVTVTDGSGALNVIVDSGHIIIDSGSTTAVTGNVTIVQPTGTNLHAVLDTTSTTAVTQATGTNLHMVVDSGTVSTITNVVHVDDNSGSLTVDNSGTFAVQATLADGASVTLGAKADAKSTATDTTAITVMSVLKEISAMEQAPASRAVTNIGTFAVQATLSAETTKVIGVVRNSDGAGNLLTSNSTTYTAKFGLDANLLGTLGTAFTTAGFVDIKGADGNIFVRQATASNLNATVVGTGTFAVQATLAAETTKVIGTVNQGTSPWIMAGGGTAGSAASGVVTVQGIASMTKLLVTPDANSAINVAQINGVTPLMGAGNTGTGSLRVTVATDQVAIPSSQSGTWTVQPGNTANTTAWLISEVPTTTAGASTCYATSAASTNATNCKGSAGNIYGIYIINTTTTNYFLRIYNASGTPTCSSATGFIETVPALGAAANGGGISRMQEPQSFSTGIAFCLTGGGSSTDNTNAATGVYVTILYK